MKDYASHLSKDAAKNISDWLSKSKFAEYKADLEDMIEAERWNDLEDAFFKVIEFGTGGRRGATGVGSNRINRVTIGESTQALCLYAQDADPNAKQKGVVIACDTRLSSPELSKYAACVAAANGYKTYIFDSFRATPELSFAVRHLNAAIGIVISASHNPPIDNGFKAYWSDGAQLVAPHDKGVLDVASGIEMIDSLQSFDEAVANGAITVIGSELDNEYIAAVAHQSEGQHREIKIAYSPLHGAGQTNVLPSLKKAGFEDIILVQDQMIPDGNFPTIENGKANPEEKSANDRVVALMLAEDADIAITNDPDADRIGAIVRKNDQAVYLTGNQTAVLATDYALKKKHERGDLSSDHYIAKTIVTTDMMERLADHYGVKCYGNMLIGFKYIGELIRKKENTEEIFVIGGEESFGLLKGDYARDKDGATGALPLAEYAAELKAEGKTLWDKMLELYEEHGLYVERLDTMTCPGAEGFAEMQQIMASLREKPILSVDGQDVTAIYDYANLTRKDVATGEETKIDCINGNVFVLEFGDKRRRITIRPSGTEPKLKFYNQWWEETTNPEQDYNKRIQRLENVSRELEGMLFERVGKSAN